MTTYSDHFLNAAQWQVFDCSKRFRVLVAGRRFGKTQLALYELIDAVSAKRHALAWYVAPTYRQAKTIAWTRLKEMLRTDPRHTASETDLSIQFHSGGTIALRGADNVDRLRGTGLDFAVLDEFASMKPQVWSDVIRPALADRRGRALFIGTPQGHNHLFERFEFANSHRDWAAFHFKTSDGGIVAEEELAGAASELDPRLFRQEFEASFESAAIGRAYHSFTREQNVRPCAYSAGSRLIWSLDFNVNPMCSILAERNKETVEVLDEIIIENANTWMACEHLWQRVQRYRHTWGALAIEVFGDASGHQRRTSGSLTDWNLIRDFFSQLRGQAAVQIQAATVNPSVRDRVNVVNSRLQNAAGEARLFIDPKCKELIADLERVCWRTDSSGQSTTELDKSDRLRTHTSDALGYYLTAAFPAGPKFGERPNPLFGARP
jgi:hypothetical protein